MYKFCLPAQQTQYAMPTGRGVQSMMPNILSVTFVDAAYFAAARVADLASNVDRHHVATMPYSHRDGVKKRNRDPDRELDSLTKVLS